MDVLDPQRHTKPLHFFLATSSRELPYLAINNLLYGCGSLSLIGGSYVLGRMVDLLQVPGHGSFEWFLVGIVVSLFCYELFYRIGHIFEVRSLSHIRAQTKRALLSHTSSLSFGYFSDRFAGEIAHKVAATADSMERLVTLITNDLVEEAFISGGSVIALTTVSPWLGLFVAGWVVVFVIALIPYARRMDAEATSYALAEAATSGAFVDMYGNIGAVKVYGYSGARSAAERRIDAEFAAYRSLGFWWILTYNFMGLSMAVLGSGILLITAYLYAHATISLGVIVFVSAIGLRLVLNVWYIGRAVPDFIRQRGEVAQNLRDLVVAPAVVDGDCVAPHVREQVSLEYRDVTFGYSDDRPVLEKFSLTVGSGQRVGIVGLSGAGKTTFANLLLRFFDVQSGAILLSGEDIRDFTQEFLRSHISYISQDTSLFHASVAENIAYGARVASREDIERAAHLAYADEFIATLPKGYESIVGERGIKLSGGQRQRIAIARAILADRPIFLLDEATSALDSDSEQKIQKGLAKLMEGKTVIAIAHRLSTLSHMDRIIYLENGTIVEDGTHEELLARGGKYAQLWRLQAGGFLPDEL